MSKSRFILKEALWIFYILAFLFISFGLINYYFQGSFTLYDFPWFMTIFVAIDLAGFINNLRRIKKLGIDLGLPENQQGMLHKTVILDMPKEKVLDLLKQNVWKYKTEASNETELGTLLHMKHYRLFEYERLTILVQEINATSCRVQLAAGVRKRNLWFLSKHSGWHQAVRHIEYFMNELSKRQDLHQVVTA